MLNGPMRMSGWLINDVQRFIASSFKIQDMMVTDAKIPIHAEKPAPSLQGHVEFKNVSFHFEDDPNTDVLKNISLKASPGQTIAILGETGAGKSTLVNLICRFYDPTSGEILIDGVDARKWHVRELRNHIATVMQDIFLFSDTIEGNIAFGARMQQWKMSGAWHELRTRTTLLKQCLKVMTRLSANAVLDFLEGKSSAYL